MSYMTRFQPGSSTCQAKLWRLAGGADRFKVRAAGQLPIVRLVDYDNNQQDLLVRGSSSGRESQ
jgi:hypothetical protein